MQHPEEFLKKYRFDLPEDRIARYPLPERDDSRLLVVSRSDGSLCDENFRAIGNHLKKGDLLIRNSAAVSKRKLSLRRKSGRIFPALFLTPLGDGVWSALIRGSGKLKEHEPLLLVKGEETVFYFMRRHPSDEASDPTISYLRAVKSDGFPASDEEMERLFEDKGRPALPPYLKREAEELDDERYQTIYAKEKGSVAAPTAGFHFTGERIRELEESGVLFCDVCLNVGYGTFAPLKEENLREKRLHPETYTISEESSHLLNAHTGRRIAVGTTALRALESNFRANNRQFAPGRFETSLFLHPPDEINSIDGLITNFHLPESSLFLLVAAFGGVELILRAYHHALERGYRFYSYGDAMLIV